MTNARLTAAKALVDVQLNKGYSNLFLPSKMDYDHLEGKDRSFCAVLFFGVLERGITLDEYIRAYCKVHLEDLSEEVHSILQLGIYQLIYLTDVPEYAAVNETVSLAEEMHAIKSKSLINAVLHAIIRNQKQLPRAKDEIQELSREYSVPQWMIKLWEKQYSKEIALEILKGSTGKAPIYVRVNTKKTTTEALFNKLAEENLLPKTVEAHPDTLEVTLNGDVTKLKTFQDGLFYVQDLSSQDALSEIDLNNKKVLDLCAAPGGKSFTMIMLGAKSVLACDLYENRIRLVENGAKRLGINIKTAVKDANQIEQPKEYYDVVLCDVPCSGLGVMRRKPEIRYKKPEELDALPPIQRKILENASKYVNQSGKLIYSTCTLNKKENERIVQDFLDNNPAWQLEKQKTEYPNPKGGDGFFHAILTKKE